MGKGWEGRNVTVPLHLTRSLPFILAEAGHDCLFESQILCKVGADPYSHVCNTTSATEEEEAFSKWQFPQFSATLSSPP